MTSNQIANASNRIQQQSVDESGRHNQAVEDETKRHNLATEGLSQQQLALETEKLDVERRYKTDSLLIQKEYNNAYLEWQKAQGTRKLDIEQQLAGIKQREQFVDEQYKADVTRIAEMEAEIKAFAQQENERSNKAQEELKSRQIANEEYKSFLTNKSLEYQNSYWNASIALGNLNAVYNEAASLRSYELGLQNINKDLTISKAELEYKLADLTAKKPTYGAQTFKYYLEGMGSLFGSATRPFTIWAFGK